MAQNKTIKFEYFKITHDVMENGRRIEKGGFNFADWLLKMKNNNRIQTLIPLKNCYARIEKMEQDLETGYWVTRFMKKRNIAPSKIYDGRDAEAIDLEDGEYIGEDVTMLYDKQNNIVMIQSNRLSLTPTIIAEFVSKTVSAENNVIVNIRPMLIEDRNIDLRDKQVRKLEIKFANVNNEISQRSSLNRLFNTLSLYHGITGKISISVGRSRDRTLNNDLVQNTIDEIQNDRVGIDSVQVSYRESSDSQIELIDLFDDVKTVYIEIQQEDNKPLDFDLLKMKMIQKYRNHL